MSVSRKFAQSSLISRMLISTSKNCPSSSSSSSSSHSALAIFARSVLYQDSAAIGPLCRDRQSHGEVDTQERRRRARALLILAALSSPSPNEKDTILEAMAELPDLEESPPTRWPGPSSPTQPVARRFATAPVFSEIPTAVWIKQHSCLSFFFFRNKGLFPSLPLSHHDM